MRYTELGDVRVGAVVKGLLNPCRLKIVSKQAVTNGDLKGHSLYKAQYIDGPNFGEVITIYDFVAYSKEV